MDNTINSSISTQNAYSAGVNGSARTDPPTDEERVAVHTGAIVTVVMYDWKQTQSGEWMLTGHKTFSATPEQRMNQGQWSALSETDKMALAAAWEKEDSVANIFTKKLIEQMTPYFMEKGWYVVEVAGKHTISTTAPSGLKDELAKSGLELTVGADGMKIDAGNGLILGRDAPLTPVAYAGLSKGQKQALFSCWNLGQLPDYLFDEKLLADDGQFGSQIFSTKSWEGAIDSQPYINPDIKVPDIPNPYGKVDFSAVFGGLQAGGVEAWAFKIMSLSTSMQNIMSDSMSKRLGISSSKDEFQFQKNLVLNKKMFSMIRKINEESKRAMEAQAKKRSIGDRFSEAWENLTSGNVTGFISEVFSICYDATIGMMMNAMQGGITGVMWVVSFVRKAYYESNGDTQMIKQMAAEMRQYEMTMDALAHKFQLGDIVYPEIEPVSEEEMAALEADVNLLTAEEREYLSYAELGASFKGINQQVRDVEGNADTATWVMMGVGLALGVLAMATGLFWAPMGIGMIVGAVNGKSQADQVNAANAYTLESEFRSAQMTHKASLVAAVGEKVEAARGNLREEIDMLSKDLQYMMEFITSLEGLLDTLLATTVNMQDSAAAGFGKK
ncbi:MAG: hypothetical protein LUC93_14690 [Planctomycetaceae bacterium]|nr:hypothetical protein [Planctomycetaceae bacterium]